MKNTITQYEWELYYDEERKKYWNKIFPSVKKLYLGYYSYFPQSKVFYRALFFYKVFYSMNYILPNIALIMINHDKYLIKYCIFF